MKPLSFQEKLRRFPPIACRLLARRRTASGYVAVTDSEIASLSKLPMAEIKRLSWLGSWDGVNVSHVDAFARACGIDFNNRRNLWRHQLYLKAGAFRHLRSDAELYRTHFIPLIEEFQRT